MKCPACGNEAPVSAFGEPLRCPKCEAYYEKAVQAQARGEAGNASAVDDLGTKHASRKRERKVAVVLWGIVLLTGFFAFQSVFTSKSPTGRVSAPVKIPSIEHLAPIETGAIPSRIGCDDGCDRLNLFEQWQPYLTKVAELQRRQDKCAKVVYVGVDHSSSVTHPTFFVTCENARRQVYNTEYTKAEVDAGSPARSDDVTQRYAFDVCDKELPRYFAGYFDGAITRRGFFVAANGRARVTYDLRIGGAERRAACLVDHTFVEFTVVQ